MCHNLPASTHVLHFSALPQGRLAAVYPGTEVRGCRVTGKFPFNILTERLFAGRRWSSCV
jgi:hypothetical protein